MNPARGGTHILRNVGQKSYHVMAGNGFNLVNPVSVKVSFFQNLFQIFDGNDSQLVHGAAGGQFHFQPAFVAVLCRPDPLHFSSCVTLDHSPPSLRSYSSRNSRSPSLRYSRMLFSVA